MAARVSGSQIYVMGKRREGREAAVQYLYQLDLNGQELTTGVPEFWRLRCAPGTNPPPKTQAYAKELVDGVCSRLAEIDEQIKRLAANYELNRLAAVDRNILRLAIYEMLYCPDVPPVVSINEAIEIAKRFGSEDSGRFVNGILDRVRSELKRPAREPQQSKTASESGGPAPFEQI
jgi:N utilization substance protein B